MQVGDGRTVIDVARQAQPDAQRACDDSALGCNRAAAHYWALTGFTDSAVGKVAQEINSEWMFAVVHFSGDGKLSITLSQRTWERQEGHYPTVAHYFVALARHPALRGLRGSFIVWLEDGMWDWCQHYARRAPVMAFGRNVNDFCTFLIPDPAFMGAAAYEGERAQSEFCRAQFPWERKRSTIFWRGAATGQGIESDQWRSTHRGKLVTTAKVIGDPNILDAKITKVSHLPGEIRDALLQETLVDVEVPFDKFFAYKYVVDADGHHCAWKSLFLKLMTGSVVLKMESSFEQWYYRHLVPWKHYVPLSRDLREIRDTYQWLISHDREAQLIAEAGGEEIRRVTLESAVEGSLVTLQTLLSSYRGV